MKKMKIFSIVFVCLFAFVFIGYAGTKVADVVTMKNKAYKKHKKGIVKFTHKKHKTEYKIGCEKCHHDASGKALTGLKDGDSVQNCIDCHKKPGYIKGKKAKGLSKKEKREYHANAMHENCISCHKKYNKEYQKKNGTKDKPAPKTCSKCHPKKKKK